MPIVTVQNFTGVYTEQPFMQGLRSAAIQDANTLYIDCADIPGTDCYCDDEAAEMIRKRIAGAGVTDARGIHFFDNGNYHYMSKIWTDMVQENFSLVVFDHHPDMQEPRFGNILSCGGWVKKVIEENKFIDNVVIIGVAKLLTAEIPSHKNVSYIHEDEYNAMVSKPGEFEKFILGLKKLELPLSQNIYLSIDKDALAPTYATTNWDQGTLRLEHMTAIIEALAQQHKIIGADICGERARDMGFEDTAAADALNNALNEKLFHLLMGHHGIQ
jgi:hypothetical protein